MEDVAVGCRWYDGEKIVESDASESTERGLSPLEDEGDSLFMDLRRGSLLNGDVRLCTEVPVRPICWLRACVELGTVLRTGDVISGTDADVALLVVATPARFSFSFETVLNLLSRFCCVLLSRMAREVASVDVAVVAIL